MNRPFFIILALLLSNSLLAAPLTEDAIRNAKTIAIMPGTYDPISEGHLAVAKQAVDDGLADITIIAVQENPKKHPIPRKYRLEMASLATGQADKVLVPAQDSALYRIFLQQSLFGIVARIKTINPQAEIKMLVGSDVAANSITGVLFGIAARPDSWIIGQRAGYEDEGLGPVVRLMKHEFMKVDAGEVSSSAIRKELLNHPEYYSTAGKAPAIFGLAGSVAQMIFRNNLYGHAQVSCAGLLAK